MPEQYISLNRAVISVSGADSITFLQGIISNDITFLEKQPSIYAYILTPQGKYLFDVFITLSGEKYIIDVAAEDAEALMKKLKMYKLRSKVELADISSEFTILWSPAGNGVPDPRSANMGKRLLASKSQPASSDLSQYHAARVENNIPEGVYDLEKEKSYPLHYRMNELNGVDYKKGCYVGQEVTARTHHRGVVRRTTYTVTANSPLSSGAEVISNEKPSGRLLTVSGNKAIALLEKEVVESGAPLTTLGIALKIV